MSLKMKFILSGNMLITYKNVSKAITQTKKNLNILSWTNLQISKHIATFSVLKIKY